MGRRRTAVKRNRNAPNAPLDDLIVSGGGSVPITSATYRSEMDIDRDGEVDSTDQTLRGTTWVAALPKGALSTPGPGSGGGVDSIVGWSGYRYDQPTRLYAVRFRFYDAVTFRWLNRDPAGYVDSMNLYGYGVDLPPQN
ncbi:MAG: hypothetical protein HRU76_04870 [Phycisphaeraceae bacterium]|nr:hypothetical protein [Phycisphaerales bacterium]QOJ16956.1 MAG: hypothetical protein HRU76_04870 [Phycisphaeraceae bacterium]